MRISSGKLGGYAAQNTLGIHCCSTRTYTLTSMNRTLACWQPCLRPPATQSRRDHEVY
jgi:hypothetical protein